MSFASIKEYISAVKQGLSLQDAVWQFLDRAQKDECNAWIEIDPVLVEREIERVQKNVDLPLYGVPLGVKDNINVKGWHTTCASRLLQGFKPPFTATAVERLRKAGCVVLGKTNLDEFAMGSSTESSTFGPVLNPYDPERVAGGSSGGSACAVSCGEVLVALGSDTGGSVRQPASFCGVVGLRPTYGRVSRFGLVAFASSLDQIGPITLNVEDAKLLFDWMAGVDDRDPTTSGGNDIGLPSGKWRIGVPREYFPDGMDGRIRECVLDIAERIAKELGGNVVSVSLPLTSYGVSVYQVIGMAEASSNLARYDGVRYGWVGEEGGDFHNRIRALRTQGFGGEVRRRIVVGTYVLSAGYYDEYFIRAQKVRRLLRDEFISVFNSVDVLITPTAPTLPFKLGEKVKDPVAMHLSDVFTAPSALAGLPAMSVPGGFLDGLPFGVQIIAPPFGEERLFFVGQRIEEVRHD